jgi:hypothetical protein
MIKPKGLLTCALAGKMLGFTPDYMRRLCLLGKIKAEKMGNTWIIAKGALKNLKRQRKKQNKDDSNGSRE